MLRRAVALIGIPGVGKSTLLNNLSTRLEFLSLQASALIRLARERSLEAPVTHDGLRYTNLDQNQQLIIKGFQASVKDVKGLVILDSHSVIERDEDFVRVDPAVFSAINIHLMIMLTDDPAAIAARREQDAGRQRPKKDVESIANLQRIARLHAEDICSALQVPLRVVTPHNVGRVCEILRGVINGEME